MKVQEVTVFRKCHSCGKISEGAWPSRLHKCGHCSKSFAPFFYFSECEVPVPSDDRLRPQYISGEFSHPVMGLTALWENSNSSQR